MEEEVKSKAETRREDKLGKRRLMHVWSPRALVCTRHKMTMKTERC